MGSHRYPWRWWLRDLPSPEPGAPTVFSTFACGGGSSMGYKLAGFDVVGNCELDPRMAATYAANLHPGLSYVEDIREFALREDYPEELMSLDVLDGSPPCTSFSPVGNREADWGKVKRFAEGQAEQRLDDLFLSFLDVVGRLRPKCFVAENVPGMLRGNAKGYVSEILSEAQGLGYSVQLFRLNSASMGVPQARERVFFIGNRMGWPKLRLEFAEEPILFGEVRGDAPGKSLPPSVARIVGMSRPFENGCRTTLVHNGSAPNMFGHTYCWDEKPSPTRTAQCSQIRMCDRTLVSDEDMVSVQTFPQDYDFRGQSVSYVTGMSVPPVMMANVAHEIREQWLS